MTTESQFAKPETSPLLPNNSAANGEPEEQEDGFDANEYVRDLIARMGGDPLTAPAAVEPIEDVESIDVPVEDDHDHVEVDDEGMDTSDQNASVEPRRAPEKLRDLEKMREAANLTTSNALHTFDCKSLILRAYSSLLVAVIAIALSLTLLSLSKQPYSVAYFAGIGMFVMAVITTWRFTASTSVLRRKLSD